MKTSDAYQTFKTYEVPILLVEPPEIWSANFLAILEWSSD